MDGRSIDICGSSFSSVLSFDLITDLATLSASTELSLWLEAVVPVDSNDHAIEDRFVESVNCERCLSSGCILDEAEATRLHLHPVQSHNEFLDLTASGEVREQLAFKCEE